MWRSHTLLVFQVIISPPVFYLLTVPRCCYFCGSYFVIYVSCLSLLFCLVFSLQPCDHLMGKSWPLGSLVCYVYLCFVIFPYDLSGQVWYLIVSIPHLSFLYNFCKQWHFKHWCFTSFALKNSCWLVLYNTIQYLLFRVSVNTVITFGRSKRRRK